MPATRPTELQLEQLERIVDLQNISYADARQQLGIPTPDNNMFTADRIKARLDAHKNNVALYHVPETPGKPFVSPESQDSINVSQRKARAAVAIAKLTRK